MRCARNSLALCASLVLAACATHAPGLWTGASRAEDARVILMTPKARMQARMSWKITGTCCGRAEIVHPASGLVVEIVWKKNAARMRTNRDPVWKPLDAEARRRLGLPAPLPVLAAFLAGRPPAGARRTPRGWRWEGQDERLHVRPIAGGRGLALEDPARGLRARVILP